MLKRLILISLFVFPFISFAQVAGVAGPLGTLPTVVSIPFGGPIQSVVTQCTCSQPQPAFIVNIFDKTTKIPLFLFFQPPFSKLFLEYNLVTPQVETVGSYFPKGPPCLVTTSNGCYEVPYTGAINSFPGVGTAAVPDVPIEGGEVGESEFTGEVGTPLSEGATENISREEQISYIQSRLDGLNAELNALRRDELGLDSGGGYVGAIPVSNQYNITTANSSRYDNTGTEFITSKVSFGGYEWARGKVSYFGGPNDTGVSSTETGAISGSVLRNLDPNGFYMAARFDYSQISKADLANKTFVAYNPLTGKSIGGIRAEDHGPGYDTGRAFDVSLGVLSALGASTDDIIYIRPEN